MSSCIIRNIFRRPGSSPWEPITLPCFKVESAKVQKCGKKIHIGYILKSDDVRTLVFSRYSENPSHTHLHIYPQTSMHLCALPHTPAHTSNHPLTPAHTSTHLSTPAHARTLLITPAHNPHIPASALNSINHMKLYVNRVN